MSDACSRVVGVMGSWWGSIGWFLFLGWMFIPYLSVDTSILLIVFLLLIVWWVIDLVDQSVEWWKVLTGMVMLVLGCVGRAGMMAIACWVIYWMRVRE